MTNLQRRAFQTGCYVAFATAAIHMVGAILTPQPPPVDDTHRQLLDLATTYKLQLPGGPNRTLMELTDGFSLVYSLMLALTGGLGLIVLRRAANDDLLFLATARALAGGYLVMLAISVAYFFLIPTSLTAVIALSFLIAAFGRPATAP
jgi:hypothetical protein